jgi:hypothetical protein
MRGRLSSVLFAVVAALSGPTYLACQLVDPESDLEDLDAGSGPSDGSTRDAMGEADGAVDGSVADAGSDGDAGSQQADADAGAPDATPFCLGVDATLCDSFDLDGPVNAAPAQDIAGATCTTGSISVIGGELTVDHPSNDGSQFSVCYVQSDATPNIRGFTLDFDLDYQILGDASAPEKTRFSIVSSVKLNLPSANDAGIQAVDFQLLLDAQGDTQFIALPYYPQGDRYVTYLLATLAAPGLPQAPTKCRVSLSADTLSLTGTASAICGGTTLTFAQMNQDPPAGISAPATLSLGYSQTGGEDALPEWLLHYDDVVFRASP